jgi:nucleoside-diphosphate-sugar epimerase
MSLLRVLVTGGAGYLGSVLCERLLSAGYDVTALDNLMYGQIPLLHLCSHSRLHFVFGDARDEVLIRRCLKDADVIIPLAAVVGSPACDRDPWLARGVNLEGVRLLNGLRSAGQLVVFPTTNSGYGIRSRGDHCTEETPLEPVSLYGQTKVQAEAELLQSPNVITLRLATMFGISSRMRVDLLVNHFVYAAVVNGYIIVFEKDFRRNYIHVRDVADCFVHCIVNAERMVGKPYNVGSDSLNLSKEQLALKIRELVPDFHVCFAEIGSDPDKRNYVVSSQRMRSTGFEAKRSLDEGIQELLKGYQMMRKTWFRNG